MAVSAVGMAVSSAVGEIAAGMAITGAVSVGVAEVIAVGGMIAAPMIGQVLGGPINQAIGLTPSPSAVASQQARGLLINSASNIDPLPVIYGSRRVGGTRVLCEVSGANNEYLNLVIALCEGEISAINTVYIDDVASSDARFSGLVTIEKYTGTDTQAASAALIAELPGVWTSAHQGKGVAYLYARLKYDQNAFHGLPNITCDIDGKLVYDPRDSTTKFSTNPALCQRNYLTNARYGRGIATSLLDDASFSAAANHCDTLVAIPGGTHKLYECTGAVNVDDTVYANTQRLLTACRGMLVFSGGKYKLVIDKAETPAFTFNVDNITGAWQIVPVSKRDKFNRIATSFFNPDRNWQPDLAIQSSAAMLAEDNGLVLEKKLDLPYTADLYRAQHIIQQELKQSRIGLAVKFSAFQEGLRCEVGDVVYLTHETPGWTNKTFRILSIDIKDNDEVDIWAREYAASVYTLDALDAKAAAPATNLPDVFSVPTPSGLTLTSGTGELLLAGDGTIISRIKVAWSAPADQFALNGSAQVQYKLMADSAWIDTAPVPRSLGPTWISPVKDGASYDVRVRFENSIGVQGSWATSAGHTVIGKTAAPANVTGFSASQNGDVVVFRWNPVNDYDAAGYEIRFVYQGGTWENGTPVTKVTRGSSITTAAVPPGNWTFHIKARDYSRNYSASAASCDLVVQNTFDIVYQENEAPDWHGTLTGLVRHWTGVLVPQSQNLASADGWNTFDQFVPSPVATCEYEHPEVALGFDANVRIWNDVDARIPPTGSGAANVTPMVDYRTGAGSYDGFEPWTVGQVNARYVKMKLSIDTGLGTPALHGFTPTLDVQEFTQRGTDNAGAGGKSLTFPQQFHSAPNAFAVYIGAASRVATVANITASGMDVHIYNTTTGAEVGGDFAWSATGA